MFGRRQAVPLLVELVDLWCYGIAQCMSGAVLLIEFNPGHQWCSISTALTRFPGVNAIGRLRAA